MADRSTHTFKGFLRSVTDPRAWIGLLRLVHHYNYTHVAPRRALTVGADVGLSPTVSMTDAQRIRIGDRSRIGDRCSLWAGPEWAPITIGRDTLLAPDVFVTAANYAFAPGTPPMDQPMDEAAVVIGDGVWIGTGVTIVAGVTIGDGAVIGAGSIVTKPIPANAVAVGAPARVVRMRDGAPVPA
ncbi:MAG: acyltransferase [Solirubrobacteraceae bacterium]|nr:acyltransferase [Solirubrobacteraceae bacterium]